MTLKKDPQVTSAAGATKFPRKFLAIYGSPELTGGYAAGYAAGCAAGCAADPREPSPRSSWRPGTRGAADRSKRGLARRVSGKRDTQSLNVFV